MTLSAMVVFAAGLASSGPGPAGSAAPVRRGTAEAAAAARYRPRAEVTCTLRIVHAPGALDAGMLAPTPARLGNAEPFDDAIVRDSVSPCAGATTRRAAAPGAEQR